MEIIEKIDNLKSVLDSLKPFNKDKEAKIKHRLRLDWNYHSNHMEGNSLSFHEVKGLISLGMNVPGKPHRDHLEIKGHNEALKWIELLVRMDYPITEDFIKEIHRMILKEPYDIQLRTESGHITHRQIWIGQYKAMPNHVIASNGRAFTFASPQETAGKMAELVKWVQETAKDETVHPLELATELHYRFIAIHPFDDGNGRSGRILLNFILMRAGYPPVIIRTTDKKAYFKALQQADNGNLFPLRDYLGGYLIESLELMISMLKDEISIENYEY